MLQRDHTLQEQLPQPVEEEYGLVNGIPAGYESDDSWDTGSHTHDHTHTHNIMPLLALRTWSNRPCRGREQQQSRQNNNVRTGHAP